MRGVGGGAAVDEVERVVDEAALKFADYGQVVRAAVVSMRTMHEEDGEGGGGYDGGTWTTNQQGETQGKSDLCQL